MEGIMIRNIQDVIRFAVDAHEGQVRKGSGLPYIIHPMAVLAKLGEWEIGCYKCWSAALCHDILEDCPDITRNDVIEAIGLDATIVVEELTFKPTENFDKIAYMRSFKEKSVHSLVIKVADRICNTLDFMSSDPQYAKKYWRKASELFEVMLNRHVEINTVFGDQCFPRMRYAQTNLNMVLQ